MSQIKRISLLVAILMVLTARQAFAPTAVEKTRGESAAPRSPSTAPGGTDTTFNEPKDQSVLSQLPAPPSDNEPTPQYRRQDTPPDCVPGNPNCPTIPDCVPPSCPTQTYEYPSPSYVYPIDRICPQGYYCRATNIIPVPGGKDGTCSINETELNDAYRDCAKVGTLCRSSRPPDVSEEHYQKLCT